MAWDDSIASLKTKNGVAWKRSVFVHAGKTATVTPKMANLLRSMHSSVSPSHRHGQKEPNSLGEFDIDKKYVRQKNS